MSVGVRIKARLCAPVENFVITATPITVWSCLQSFASCLATIHKHCICTEAPAPSRHTELIKASKLLFTVE